MEEDRPDAEQLGNLGNLGSDIDLAGLQQITEDPPWKNQETRHYSVTPTPGVTAMKLKIIAAYATPVLRLYEFRPVFGAPPN